MNTINYEKMSPVELVRVIKENFADHKECKLSRYSIKWGKWSRQMNVAIRARLGGNEPKTVKDKLMVVHNYWKLVSEILELYLSSGFFNGLKRNKFIDEAQGLENIIKGVS